MQVVDLMTTDVVTVAPDSPLKQAARLMFRHRVSGLPVVDDTDRLVGMITEADFLRLQVEREISAEHGFAGPHPITEAERVSEVMSKGVITVDPEMSLGEAARIMTVQEIKRLPVVDDEGKLLGIISRMDIVALYTRPDEVIEDEIREDLIRRVLFVDPDGVDVRVSQGVVTLIGEIGTRTEAALMAELTRRLDGVVRVENRLGWRVDDEGK
jgi:CBS-domain-containing membrane protein